MVHVIKSFNHPDKQVIEKFAEISPATAHEVMGKKGALDSRIKPIYHGMKVCGPALTVQCHPADNLMLHKAIALASPGDVIVATVGLTEAGYWGEVMTVAAQARGINGLVIDGCVRDGLDLKKRKFPAFSTGLCVKGTVKETVGFINKTICCGGVIINPGDIVLGDDDGVVVVPFEIIDEVIEKSMKRIEREEKLMEVLASQHVTTLEIDGLDKILQIKGCIEQ